MIRVDDCAQLTPTLYAQASFGKQQIIQLNYCMYHITPTNVIKEVVSRQMVPLTKLIPRSTGSYKCANIGSFNIKENTRQHSDARNIRNLTQAES